MSKSLIKVYQRGTHWHYSFTSPAGQRVRRATKAETETAARELAASHYNQAWREAKLGDRPRYLWTDAVVEWLTERPDRAGNQNYTIHLRWLDTYLGSLFIDEIDRETIKEIRRAKEAEGVKNRTINAVLQQTRVVLKSCIDWGWIDTMPKIQLLPEPKRRVRWLSLDEEERLMSELPDHMRLIVRFALATGLRMSNILGLTWNQVDLQRSQAWIYADQAKSGRSIGVPLNSEALAVLGQCLGRHPEFVFIFRGKPILRVNGRAWRDALERACISDFHFHDLRHTWATRHIMNGTPAHVLQELGGWADISMLQKYAHMSVEHLKKHAENSR